MITNQLSFIPTVAAAPTEAPMATAPSETREARGPASGLLWIALNEVGMWSLTQDEVLLHTFGSTVTLFLN